MTKESLTVNSFFSNQEIIFKDIKSKVKKSKKYLSSGNLIKCDGCIHKNAKLDIQPDTKILIFVSSEKEKKILNTILQAAEIKNYSIFSIVKCNNEQNNSNDKYCNVIVDRIVQSLNAKLIILVGNSPKDCFKIHGEIKNIRGRILNTKQGEVLVTHTTTSANFFKEDLLGVSKFNHVVMDFITAKRYVEMGKKYKEPANIKIITTSEDMYDLINKVKAKAEMGEVVAADFETTGLDIFSDNFKVLTLGLALSENDLYVVDFVKNPALVDLGKDLWKEGKLVFFNANYDGLVARKIGWELKEEYEDTQLMWYLIQGGLDRGGTSLKDLALAYTSWGDYAVDEDEKRDLSNIDTDRLYTYNAIDVAVTIELYNKFKQLMLNSNFLVWDNVFGRDNKTLWDAYNVIKKYQSLLIEIQWNGMYIDSNYLNNLLQDFTKKSIAIQNQIQELIGKDVNIRSPKQITKVLQDRNFSISSTDKNTLEQLKGKDQFIDLLLEYRFFEKIIGTYLQPMLAKINPNDGCIRGSFSLTRTSTGRVASFNPNLMNIPNRMGSLIEKSFISRWGEDGLILKADMSQHELRVAAMYSNDKKMKEFFNSGIDIHTKVAREIYGLKDEDIGTPKEKELRRIAKGFNFGVIYGRGAASIAAELKVSEKEAEKMMDQYFSMFRGLKNWLDKVQEFAKKNLYVRTAFGRWRKFEHQESIGSLLREGVNTPVQSAASDIAMMISTNLMWEMKNHGLESKIINFIHDAVLIDAKKTEIEQIKQILQNIVQNIQYPFKNPGMHFMADIVTGKSWGECK